MAIPYQQISENVGTIFDNPGTKWIGPVEFDSTITTKSNTIIDSTATHMTKTFQSFGPKSDITTYHGYNVVPVASTVTPFQIPIVASTQYNVDCILNIIYNAGDIGNSVILKQSHRVLTNNVGVPSYVLSWAQTYNGGAGGAGSDMTTSGSNMNMSLITLGSIGAVFTWSITVFRTSL